MAVPVLRARAPRHHRVANVFRQAGRQAGSTREAPPDLVGVAGWAAEVQVVGSTGAALEHERHLHGRGGRAGVHSSVSQRPPCLLSRAQHVLALYPWSCLGP